ncbi:hypothetical protein T492DRAFT_841048 [Pavlovales sp. CCMP2436]|nr:hypothetical protein T492DRAFT_841048 [Pavlovales sp. CCMP2436]
MSLLAILVLFLAALPTVALHVEHEHHRQLQSGEPPPFDLDACTEISSIGARGHSRRPRGSCYKAIPTASLRYKGIHVVGRLAIDTSAGSEANPLDIDITTNYVFIEGVFSLHTNQDDVVPLATVRVTLTLIEPADGATSLSFSPCSAKLKDSPPRAVGVKAMVVWGGLLDIRAINMQRCVAWARLKQANAADGTPGGSLARTLVLDASVGSCWAPGADLLVTSCTTNFKDVQPRWPQSTTTIRSR